MAIYSILGEQDLSVVDQHGTNIQWFGFWSCPVLYRHKGRKIGSGTVWRQGTKGYFKATIDWKGTKADLVKCGWSIMGFAETVANVKGVPHQVVRAFGEVSLTPYPSNKTARVRLVSQR